jgi:hypothetical protein
MIATDTSFFLLLCMGILILIDIWAYYVGFRVLSLIGMLGGFLICVLCIADFGDAAIIALILVLANSVICLRGIL